MPHSHAPGSHIRGLVRVWRCLPLACHASHSTPASPQGAILEAKRTYRGVFEAIGHPAVLARLRALNESLLLVGAVMRKHPPPEPAPEVAPHVRIVANLRFEARRRGRAVPWVSSWPGRLVLFGLLAPTSALQYAL